MIATFLLKLIFIRKGPYTREDGFLGYNEVCEEILDQKQPWTRMWDKEQGVTYLFRYSCKYKKYP